MNNKVLIKYLIIGLLFGLLFGIIVWDVTEKIYPTNYTINIECIDRFTHKVIDCPKYTFNYSYNYSIDGGIWKL